MNEGHPNFEKCWCKRFHSAPAVAWELSGMKVTYELAVSRFQLTAQGYLLESWALELGGGVDREGSFKRDTSFSLH